MSTSAYVELPYPFRTAGTKILYVICIICDNLHTSQAFFPSSRNWSSPTYRWDRYEDLDTMDCPSCGATPAITLGLKIGNFLMKIAYDQHYGDGL